MLTLSQALRITKCRSVAFVGSGGKTSAMFLIAREQAPALVTTSTHISGWQSAKADVHFIWEADAPMPDMEASLGSGVSLVTGKLDEEKQRYTCLSPEQLEQLRELAGYHALPLLIEADGSRQRPLKAPAEHEPAIPAFVETVIVVAGLSAVHKPLSAELVHRPHIFSELSGLAEGELLSSQAVARVLSHPAGGLKNIPPGARRVVLLNQAETPERQALAGEIARGLLPAFDGVVTATLKAPAGDEQSPVIAVQENIAGILLAAGDSTRYGQPKQFLDYHGQPFVRAVAETALQAGLFPVIVVGGAHTQAINAALAGLPVSVVHNPDWEDGQSTSLKVGLSRLSALSPESGGAIFLLVDQPQVSVEVLRALQERHSQDLPAVLAPYVFDQRANPLLFDRLTFADLMNISGDTGGRAVFSKFSPRYVNWYDRRLLLDVDTPADYEKLLNGE